MKSSIKKFLLNTDKFLLVYLAIYFVINLVFLTKFPVMHSDESWLSGLTLSMMNEGLGTTEYFFDLIPRYPHAIKIIFHIIQMPFILLFGYNLFAVRLVSLIFAIISLILIYKIINRLTDSKGFSIIGLIAVSFDIQFIYASHFARQEIIIVFFILSGIYFIVSRTNDWSMRNDIITGAIIGLSVGIHPNSFLVALIVGAVYLYYIIFEKKLKIKNLAIVIIVTALSALVFVGISYIFNSNFINDYLKYGDNLGTTASGIMKIFSFPSYYRKLFNAFSVTYYTPNIKIQFIIFAVGIIIGLLSLFIGKDRKKAMLFILPIIGLNIGYLTIGRYSQPGIVFLFPLSYLLVFVLLNKIKKAGIILSVILAALIAGNTLNEIIPQMNYDYKEYIEEMQNTVPNDAEVLANLNTEYAFDFDKLHDYRNLDKLDDMTFREYIYENQIEYIIYPEEMDYIYENRPVWNVMYGNVFPYYEDMNDFLENDCKLVYEFESPYAMRIMMFSNDKEWTVKIYKVLVGKSE